MVARRGFHGPGNPGKGCECMVHTHSSAVWQPYGWRAPSVAVEGSVGVSFHGEAQTTRQEGSLAKSEEAYPGAGSCTALKVPLGHTALRRGEAASGVSRWRACNRRCKLVLRTRTSCLTRSMRSRRSSRRKTSSYVRQACPESCVSLTYTTADSTLRTRTHVGTNSDAHTWTGRRRRLVRAPTCWCRHGDVAMSRCPRGGITSALM